MRRVVQAGLLIPLAWLALLARAAQPIAPRATDCIDEAAAYRQVSPTVLRAIAWHESRMREDAVSRNSNGSVDLGAFQINSIHLPRLSRERIGRTELLDGCVSAYVAAWHLRQQIDRYGPTWEAVGAYHSRTPALNRRYAQAIAGVARRVEAGQSSARHPVSSDQTDTGAREQRR